MEIKIKSYSSQSSLLSSILFFILGAILFTSAEKVIATISIIIGVIFATSGVMSLVVYFFKAKNGTNYTKGSLIYGIIAMILAIIFIFFSILVEQFIRFIVGAWILFTGIIRLINVLSLNKNNNKFFSLLIVSLLLIAVGVYTILIGDIIFSTLGLIMMIYAAIEIAGYILSNKDSKEPEEPGTTTLIVPDSPKEDIKENNKKNKKIKEVKEKKQKLLKNKEEEKEK
jgi:uncharacterized membrane protein HdeD (DUF308 family)